MTNLIIILLFILCVINPFIALFSYRKAIQDMQRIDNKQEIKTSIELPNIPKKYKPTEEQIELEKVRNAVNDFKVVL